MTSFENLSVNQKVRAALHEDVHTICTEICHLMGLDITRPADGIIAELLISKLTLYGLDLETFAKHAKRTTINADDVKLLARRNPSLKARLNKIFGENTKDRRKTIPANRTETPKSKKNAPTKKIQKEVQEVEVEPGPSKEPERMEEDAVDLTLSLSP